MKKPLIIITGPTAAGKTALSVKLAEKINGEIISADSMQVYRHMNVGTAKITPEEMKGIKHHLIDVLNPDEEFNVYFFKKMAEEAMEGIYERSSIPIIAGGTGFYIQALLYDVKFDDTVSDAVYREELYRLAEEKGSLYVHGLLKKADAKAAEQIHYNNLKRVIRALEYNRQTGKAISEHNDEQRQNVSPYNFAYFVINDDREKLYSRINRRVDLMFENGLEEEVEKLEKMGCTPEMTSMKAIGYREFFEEHDDVRESIKIDTRHFAKRQLTWFRREKNVEMINIDEFDYNQEKILEYMMKCMKEKEII